MNNEVPGTGYGDICPSNEYCIPERPTGTDAIQPPGSTCWGKELKRSQGAGPWGRRLFMYTVWCGKSGQITYRTSSKYAIHDTFCHSTNGPFLQKTAGGAGWPWVEVQVWVEIECASIPTNWPKYHDSMMFKVRYWYNGLYQTVAHD